MKEQMKEKIIEHEGKKYKVIEIIEDFKNFTFKGKRFKIYPWKNKPFGDLINNLPKNERLATFQEFNEALEEKAFKVEIYKYYITKHFNKLQWDKEYCLSRCCLNRLSGLSSGSSDLSFSYDDGRVVVIVE